MSNLVYFPSVSKTPPSIRREARSACDRIPLHGRIEVDEPYVLVLLRPAAAGAPRRTSTTVAMSGTR